MKQEEQKAVKYGTILFHEVYKKNITEEMFADKHFKNPTRLDIPYIIESKNDKPVAMRWMMRENMLYKDVSFSAVQSSDDAVLPEARGLLFLKMRKKALDVMKEEHIDFEYGCFSKGDAMEIAEKFGEVNVVNLYLARFFLHEKSHHWKRFNIPYPTFLSNILLRYRKKRLMNLSSNRIDVQITNTVPFTEDDYRLFNGDGYLHIERNEKYYCWKTQAKGDISFIVARENNELQGFLIVKNEGKYASIIDWNVFSDQCTSVLATMLLPICEQYQYIDIPSLNISNGEMRLFTDIGCKDMSELWAPICICVKPLNDEAGKIVLKAENWKHRLIDADYFLNG